MQPTDRPAEIMDKSGVRRPADPLEAVQEAEKAADVDARTAAVDKVLQGLVADGALDAVSEAMVRNYVVVTKKLLGARQFASIIRQARNRQATAEAKERGSVWPAPQDPMAVARRYLKHRVWDGVPLLRRWRGSWMRWMTTHWAEIDEGVVKAELYADLEHAVYLGTTPDGDVRPVAWQPNRNKLANVLDALAGIVHLPDKVSPPAWVECDGTRPPDWGASGIVSCANGLLDVTTREMQPHSPAFFNVVSVPFGYEPDATAPMWASFLAELWPDDPDSVSSMQEFFGYLISGRTDLHKILLVIGPTRAGKGTIGRIMKRLLGGDENVAGPTLASLGGQFGLMPLVGKPLAIVSDARISGHSTVVVERLLSISGEDTLTVDRKHREMWTGQLPTRFVILSNELPGFGDASGAIAYRFIVLVLTHSWLHREDRELTGKLAGELAGIFNWSLDGLARLNEAGKFTEPKTSEDAIITLLDQASPISAFVRDSCETSPCDEVEVDDLFAAWRQWCDENGRSRPGSVQDLGKKLRAAVPSVRQIRPRQGTARYRAYQGIRLNKDWAEKIAASKAHSGEERGPARTTPPEPEPPSEPVRAGPRKTPLQRQLSNDFPANGEAARAAALLEERLGGQVIEQHPTGEPAVTPDGACPACGDTEDSIFHAEICQKAATPGRTP